MGVILVIIAVAGAVIWTVVALNPKETIIHRPPVPPRDGPPQHDAVATTTTAPPARVRPVSNSVTAAPRRLDRPQETKDWYVLPKVKAALATKPPDFATAKTLLAPLMPYEAEFSSPRRAELFRYVGEVALSEGDNQRAADVWNFALSLNPTVGIKRRRDTLLGELGQPIPTPAPTTPSDPIRSGPCPYCEAVLTPAPKRKKRCPECGETIYVKGRPSDRTKRPVTEAQDREIEAEWTDYHVQQSHLSSLAKFGVTAAEGETIRSELEAQFGSTPSDGDVVWAAAAKKVAAAMERQDWQALRSLYFNQALYLRQAGRDSFVPMTASRRCELMQLKLEGAVTVEISGSTGCDHCKALDGRQFNIDRALREMPIPAEKCTHQIEPDHDHGWCRCMWLDARWSNE